MEGSDSRTFLKGLAAVQAVGVLRPSDAAADLPKAKITRVRIYRPPDLNPRPGLGVTAEMKRMTQIGEVTEPGRRNIFRRPDGSLTH